MTRFSVPIFTCILLSGLAGSVGAQNAVAPPSEKQSVIVVVGAEGAPEYGSQFAAAGQAWVEAAGAGHAVSVAIGMDRANDTGESLPPADRELLISALAEQSAIETSEPLWLVLIGHGTFDNRTALFNLRGEDVSAAELADWLTGAKRPVAIINCASSSSPFINALSGPDRVVITATKNANEFHVTRFGTFMAEAISGTDADVDRDGQTSLLEAWLHASRRTDEFYKSDGRLATEHALLDDNGDALGVRTDLFEGARATQKLTAEGAEVDGRLAARWHLVRSDEERRLTPEQRAERDELEDQLEALREQRDDFEETVYLQMLESILVPLARLYESVETE